jgi:hypothetical protein
VPSRIAELLQTAPNWATVDPHSAQMVAWLQQAHQAVRELDPAASGTLGLHLQFLDDDIVRHGAEIVNVLRRVDIKTKAQ